MKKHWRKMALLGAAVLVLWILWADRALVQTDVMLTQSQLPELFDGFRIAQVSDLHNTQFGKKNEKLLALLRQAQPDMIAITGDMIDSRRTDIAVALDFAEEAVKIAPCYYVTGNHESRIPEYAVLEQGLEAAGVTVLRNETVTLERDGQLLTVAGVDDPAFSGREAPEAVMDRVLQSVISDGYTLLLSHRPELFGNYCQNGADVVLSGHAHGGQFRLPLVGGLVAPGQGLFPKYDAGVFSSGSTSMVVSRGLGNSIIPIRIGNRPEVVVITLCGK